MDDAFGHVMISEETMHECQGLLDKKNIQIAGGEP